MPQQAFGFRRSVATADAGCVVVCLSLSNADMIVSCNGQTKTIQASGGDATWTDVGTDAPVGHFANGAQLGYVANVTLTGLSANTNYTYTVSQGGTEYSANIYVVPDDELTDFTLFFNTCDHSTTFGGGDTPGYYQYIRAYTEADDGLPVAGILHVDDHYGYIDYTKPDDSAGTGHYFSADGGAAYPYQTALEYDFALGYFAAFGLLEDATDPYVKFGHDEDYIWCLRNLGVMPQWGDHDTGANEMGWNTNPAISTGFTNAKAVWDLVMKPLIAAEISSCQNLDTTAYHWYKDIGPVRVVCLDGITNATGDATDPWVNDGTAVGPTTLFGNNQIDDCLSALKVSKPFKLLGLTYSIRHMGDVTTGLTSKNAGGAQNPLADEMATEYARLFTDADGIMGSPHCNGQFGTLVALHGDIHVCHAYKNENTDGTNDEWFYSIGVGTGTGSINFENFFNLQAGDSYNGSTVELFQTTPGGHSYYGCRLDVYASRYPKEMIVGLYDMTNTELWRKKFVSGRGGNDAHSVDNDLSLEMAAVAVNDGL